MLVMSKVKLVSPVPKSSGDVETARAGGAATSMATDTVSVPPFDVTVMVAL